MFLHQLLLLSHRGLMDGQLRMLSFTKPTLRSSIMRIGPLEKRILSVLLDHGAKTSYELATQIENVDITGPTYTSHESTRAKAFQRAIKQLQDKNLITAKPYFEYHPYFVKCMSKQFWAEGRYWERYNRSGFLRNKTRPFRYENYSLYGLSHEGRIRASEQAWQSKVENAEFLSYEISF